MNRPASPRSKPPTLPSAGSSFSIRRAKFSSRENRSRRVFAYSTRLSRRMGTRPPAPWAALVVSSNRSATHDATAKASFASGRGFFSGGISPELIRSMTSFHKPALFPAVKSVVSRSIRKPARAVSSSWQSMQCWSINDWIGGAEGVFTPATQRHCSRMNAFKAYAQRRGEDVLICILKT
jgi:hypothetical protein